ncbi:MAG: hypothetical protein ACLUDL_21010 [Eubacterium callanderi]|uniref:hypothetical protein n=1 Tax=Eubacterium callanderi TaxID=53442 RepID=UPI003990E249
MRRSKPCRLDAEVKKNFPNHRHRTCRLLIAYYNQRNAGAWSNKARTGNLKQFAEAHYLTENKLLTLEDLQERLSLS